MTRRRPWIHTAKPLIFPAVVLATLAILAAYVGDLSVVDKALIALVKTLPAGLKPEFTFVTNLGTANVLIPVAIIVAGVELRRRHYMRSLVVAMSLLSLPSYYIVKEVVRRARPVTEFVRVHGLHDYSFPSGHTTGSAAVYGLLAVLVANSNLKYKKAIVTGLVVLIFLIGLSRVYLGAHFPTDVIGGWLLALTIVSLLRSLTLAVAKRSDRPDAQADTTE